MPLNARLKWLLVACAVLGVQAMAYAQSSHPFGVPEQSSGLDVPDSLRTFFGYISYWQSHFYRQLTDAVRQWQAPGGWGGLLVGLSFAYGVFHALGPGHGKAVIASYVLANRQTARNGALLALSASAVQALVAIAMVSVLALVFNVTAAVMNEATRWLEVCAYALVVLLGLMLVWRKAIRPLLRSWRTRTSGRHGHEHGHQHPLGHESPGSMVRQTHDHSDKSNHSAHHVHNDDRVHSDHHVHNDHHDCCGHAHAPDPQAVAGQLNMRRAWVAILAIGLRPCSGALIVLVFALAQDFYLAGVVSALAMGVGTGLTVAALAMLSAWAGAATTRLGGVLSSRAAIWVRYAIEAVASLLVLALGLLLLGAALLGSGTAGA